MNVRFQGKETLTRPTWHDAVSRVLDADSRARTAINMVPSENMMSPLAHKMLSTDFVNRYFFNPDLREDFWQFRGAKEVGSLESKYCIPAISRLSHANFVNIRPVSGLNAMTIAMAALGGARGSTVLTLSAQDGGHYATSAVGVRLGYTVLNVGIKQGEVDCRSLVKALASKPTVFYVDLQNSLHELRLQPLLSVVREYSPMTKVHVDISHTMGLVLGGAHCNPLDLGADSAGGSTHKTFPGPHKGILMTNDAVMAEDFAAAQLDLLSSHHFGATLALAVTALEFESYGEAYAAATIANAKAFVRALSNLGFEVETTETHQVWVSVGDATTTERLARVLDELRIRVNIQLDLPGRSGPALRLGTNEVTLTGATPGAMEDLAAAFKHARLNRLDKAADSISRARMQFQLPYYQLPGEAVATPVSATFA